jgi:hypothetical protein
MAKFLVTVDVFFQPLRKELTIYAQNEEEAGDRAIERVSEWRNFRDCEVVEVESDD